MERAFSIYISRCDSFGYDSGTDQAACGKPYRSARLFQPPCDLNRQSYCTSAGSTYPWHAVRRFIRENQGLMKRMYGNERQITILKAELETNDVNENENIHSRHGGGRDEEYYHNIEVKSRYSKQDPYFENDLFPQRELYEKDYPQMEYREREFPQREYPQREHLLRENHEREYPQREYREREYSRKENQQKEYSQSDYPQREFLQRESLQKDNSQTEYLHKDNTQKGYPQKDNSQRSNLQRDSSQRNNQQNDLYPKKDEEKGFKDTARLLQDNPKRDEILNTKFIYSEEPNLSVKLGDLKTMPHFRPTTQKSLEKDVQPPGGSFVSTAANLSAGNLSKISASNTSNLYKNTLSVSKNTSKISASASKTGSVFENLTEVTAVDVEDIVFDKLTLDKYSLDKYSLDKQSFDKHSLDKHSLDKHSLVEHSLDKHSLDKHSLDKHSFDKLSLDKHSLDKVLQDKLTLNKLEEIALDENTDENFDENSTATETSVDRTTTDDSTEETTTLVEEMTTEESKKPTAGAVLFQDMEGSANKVTNQMNFKLRGVNACPVKEEVVAPFWANNTRGEVLALLNLYPFEQYVHWEKCTYEHRQMYCREGCRCEQQYRLHRLLAYDPKNECRGIFSDWFRFPSCCVCKCYDMPAEFRVTSRSPRSKDDGDQNVPNWFKKRNKLDEY